MDSLKSAKPIILVVALVLFILAALGVSHPRFNLGWAGLACLTLYWFF